VVEPERMVENINIVKTDYDITQKNVKGDNKKYIDYMTDIFEKAVKKIQPDIINFHDYGDLAESIVKHVCSRLEIPYVITCHLYEAKNVEYSGYEDAREVSKRLLELPNIKIITVSNGMKRKILKDYRDYDEKRLVPILNGTDFKADRRNDTLKKELGIGNKKVLLCVGSIGNRKNQIQLLRVFEQDASLREKVFVIFCGKMAVRTTYNIIDEIEKADLADCMLYVGALQNEEMKDFYSISDALIMPSYAEGLSISALEAIAYGLPIIMYEDSECADDLHDQRVSCFADSHSDASMGKAIHEWYEKSWDSEYIKNYSKRFTMDEMARNYLKFYEKTLLKV
jgi:glycosyltransferase involved in cell wall biosynthesis